MTDLEQQTKAEDKKLVDGLKSARDAATDREQMVRKSLGDATNAGLTLNEAALKYAAMRQEANANRDLYIRLTQQAEEAGLAAGSRGSELFIVDYARQPVKPVSPNLPVLMAITLFVSLWLGIAAVFMREMIRSKVTQVLVRLRWLRRRRCWARAGADSEHIWSADGCCPHSAIDRDEEASPTQKMRPPFGIPRRVRGWPEFRRARLLRRGCGGCADRPGDLLEVSEAHTPGDACFGSRFRGGHGDAFACR